MQHQIGERDNVKATQYIRNAFVVSHQASVADKPGKASLHDPPPREEDETFLGLRQSHDRQLDPVLDCVLGSLLSCVPLVDERDFDGVPRGRLSLLRERGDLGAFLHVSRCDLQGQQVANGINRHMYLAPSLALVSVIPRSLAALGGGLKGARVWNRCIESGLFLFPPLPCSEWFIPPFPIIARSRPTFNRGGPSYG